MSPVELRVNSVSLHTQWWTAVCVSLSVGWMLQQVNVCSSSSVCCHWSCSSQPPFSSTQHRPAENDSTLADCSSLTPESKESDINPHYDRQSLSSLLGHTCVVLYNSSAISSTLCLLLYCNILPCLSMLMGLDTILGTPFNIMHFITPSPAPTTSVINFKVRVK